MLDIQRRINHHTNLASDYTKDGDGTNASRNTALAKAYEVLEKDGRAVFPNKEDGFEMEVTISVLPRSTRFAVALHDIDSDLRRPHHMFLTLGSAMNYAYNTSIGKKS